MSMLQVCSNSDCLTDTNACALYQQYFVVLLLTQYAENILPLHLGSKSRAVTISNEMLQASVQIFLKISYF